MDDIEKQKYFVTVHRTIYPYNQFLDLTYYSLEQAEKQEKLRFNNCLITMIFCAFSIEAYVNHLGAELIPDWETNERKMSFDEKITRLFKMIDEKCDKRRKPYCYLNTIFDFRKEIVHAKTSSITKKQSITTKEIPDLPKVLWEKMVTVENAKKFRRNSEEIINSLCRDLLNEDHPIGTPEISHWSS